MKDSGAGVWVLNFAFTPGIHDLSPAAPPLSLVFGTAGNDTLIGTGGPNVFVGGPGDDIIVVDHPNDSVIENGAGGSDTVRAVVGYELGTLARVEFLAADVSVTAGLSLTGNNFVNTLIGSAFDDTLTGAGGADTLTGGAGADRFRLRALGDSSAGPAGRDFVSDFSDAEGDLLDFSGLDANIMLGGDQAFAFIGLGAFIGVAGQLRSAMGGGIVVVSGDVNGDATADFAVTLSGIHTLTPGNFVL